MPVEVDSLREFSIFEGLPDENLKELSLIFSKRTYRRGEIIFTEGEEADRFYLLYSGRVKITKASTEGKEVIIEIIIPGEPFGAMAVLQGGRYPATAETMEASTTIEARRDALIKVCENSPGLLLKLTSKIAERVRESHEMLKGIAFEKVEARIAKLLLRLSEKIGHKTPQGLLIDMRLTKQDIAEMTGTTVETAIRTMSKLKKEGLVIEENKRIILPDPQGLKKLYLF